MKKLFVVTKLNWWLEFIDSDGNSMISKSIAIDYNTNKDIKKLIDRVKIVDENREPILQSQSLFKLIDGDLGVTFAELSVDSLIKGEDAILLDSNGISILNSNDLVNWLKS